MATGEAVEHEVVVLREALAAHRAVLMGAHTRNEHLDLDRALHIHAGLAGILTRWEEFSAGEQRKIMATVEYLINPTDAEGGDDLRDPDGFVDDLAAFDRLQRELGLAG